MISIKNILIDKEKQFAQCDIKCRIELNSIQIQQSGNKTYPLKQTTGTK